MWPTVMLKPDISNAAPAVAPPSHNPTARQWKAVLMVIKYVLETKDLGLMFERGSGMNLSVFTHANCGEKTDERRCVAEVTVTLGNSVVSRGSSTQNVVTRQPRPNMWHSGMELRRLFAKSVSSFVVPSVPKKCFEVSVDSEMAIDLANNPGNRQGPSTPACGSIAFDNW